MSGYFLGLDGGNSKTVALISDADGNVKGWGRAGVGDIYGRHGEQDAVDQVMAAVGAALSHAGLTPADIAAAAFRLAGVDWDEDASFWSGAIADRLPELNHFTVQNDGFAMLRWGHLSGDGVAVGAGTGPAVAGRGPAGEFAASWWIQEHLGGAAIGEAAFRAVMRAHLQLGPSTTLTAQLLGMENVESVEKLLWEYTRRVNPRPLHDLKKAARVVLQAADHGDEAACDIVTAQANSLARYVEVAARQCGWEHKAAIPVVLGGSLLTSASPALRDRLMQAILTSRPAASVAAIGGSPTAGALLDAIAEGGAQLTEEIRDRIRAADIPADLFTT